MSTQPTLRAFYLSPSAADAPAAAVPATAVPAADAPAAASHASPASAFAVLHAAHGPARAKAVLMCPPFGWDDMCSYRIRREWAERLAREGYATLRIDLPGSGDSAGAAGDPGQLDAWTSAVDAAARWLRDAEGAGTRQVAVIGIGLGGLVACRAVSQGAPIDELVLWSVPARGRTLVRELRVFSQLEVANVLAQGESTPGEDPLEEGAVAANGYLLSSETVRELEALDLRERAFAARAPRRALLLGRDGMKIDEALAQALERAGSAVERADGPGFGAMMTETQDARPPLEVFKLLDAWLAKDEPQAAAPATAVGEQEPTASTTRAASTGSSARPGSRAHDELKLEHAGVALRERPLFLEGPSGRLFGVLCEPLGTRLQLTALLLNAGPQRRTGPNRMWVEIARRWAARGVPTLRLDADGIGDADGDGAALGQVAAFYRPRYVEQTRVALELLAARGLPPRFVTLGLCSGGYWAAQAALRDERVASVIMLNPRTLVFDEWRHAARRSRHLRERALEVSTW
ncbi:MAG TPA: alpha/beta hydrolase, partial [Solirubrobacteraceae bacterium]|nr:alpha/beta hydrolase [Solirubrobacteraceae bacterium]